jgi:phospholipase/carboxylesterase
VRVGDNDVEALSNGAREAAQLVARFVKAVMEDRPTLGKPIVAGFSQGGIVTFALAALDPTRLRYAIPISGWLPPPLYPSNAADTDRPPICAIHGTADRIVPFAPTREALKRLDTLGYPTALEPVPHMGHELGDLLWEAFEERLALAIEEDHPHSCVRAAPIRID